MSGMAEVLRQVNKDHGHVHTYRGGAQGCRCGQRDPNMVGTNSWIWGHVAEVSAAALSAAGFGDVVEARAGALEEAARDLSWFGAQGNLVHPDTAWAGVCACMKALENIAKKLRGGS